MCLFSADAENEVLSSENPEFSKVLSLKLAAGPNIALHAPPADKSATVLTPAFLIHLASVFPDLLPLL